jgi:hypothetical protein
VVESLTRKVNEKFVKTIFQAETDLASGLTLEQGLRELHSTVKAALVDAVEGKGPTQGGIPAPIESPVPLSPSPAPVTEKKTESKPPLISPTRKPDFPGVPVTAQLRFTEGVKQYPIEGEHGVSLGTINAAEDGSELSIVPEQAVLRDCGSIGSLIYKCLDGMKAKHGFDYRIEVDKDGVLRWIHIKAGRDPIERKQIDELRSYAKWAFEHAPRKPTQ